MEAGLLNKGDEVLVPTSSHASDPEAVDLVNYFGSSLSCCLTLGQFLPNLIITMQCRGFAFSVALWLEVQVNN